MMLAGILMLASAAMSPDRIDRAIALRSAALEQAEAPLVRARGDATRLRLAPPLVLLVDRARRDELARARARAKAWAAIATERTTGMRGTLTILGAMRVRLTGRLPAGWPTSPLYRLPGPALGAADPPAPAALALRLAAASQVGAPAAGRVTYAGLFRGYRGVVILDHGHGWVSVLTGLGQVVARIGESVTPGSALGRMAAPNDVLAIELRHHGVPVDVARMAALR